MRKGKVLILFFSVIPSFLASCGQEEDKFYTAKFVNYDGTLLDSKTYRENTTPSYNGKDPTRDPIKGTSYVFNNQWLPALAPIHKDTIYTAQYDEHPNFTISFYNDEQLIEEQYLMAGEELIYKGKTPKKLNEGDIYYYFKNWDPELKEVTGNQRYDATFGETTVDSDLDYDGLVDYKDPYPLSNVQHAKFVYGQDSGEMNFKVDYTDFITKSNEEYNSDLAKLSVALATDSYNNGQVLIDQQIVEPKGLDDDTAMYHQFGCKDEDIEIIDTGKSEWDADKNDTNYLILAKHAFNYENSTKTVIFCNVGSSNGKIDYWLSNFDIGADTIDYRNQEGESHPIWDKHKEFHKGYYTSAVRLEEELIKYLDNKGLNNEDTTIFINGHSRGANIGNILGYLVEKDSALFCKTFTYTSGGAPTIFKTGSDVPKAKTVFNLVNKDDLLNKYPFEYFGASRFGTDKEVSIMEHLSDEYYKLTGKTYSRIEKIDEILNKIKEKYPDRNSLYKISDTPYYEKTFIFKSKAEDKMNSYIDLLKKLGVSVGKVDDSDAKSKNYLFSLTSNSNGYTLRGYSCPNAIHKISAYAFTHDTVDLSIINLFSYLDDVIQMVIKNGGGLLNVVNAGKMPHYLSCYYLIADYIKE